MADNSKIETFSQNVPTLNKSAKQIWNEMANLNMDLWNHIYHPQYSQANQTGFGIWTITITQDGETFNGCFGVGTSNNKAEAEKYAYDALLASIRVRMRFVKAEEKLIRAMSKLLLACGDVESNPGPTTLLTKRLKINEFEDKTYVTLPNGFHFWTENSNIDLTLDTITFKELKGRMLSEIEGFLLNQDTITAKEFQGKMTIETIHGNEGIRRSTIWSNHSDYNPEKRCGLKVMNSLLNCLHTNDLAMGVEEREGRIVRMRNFFFMPRNLLWLNFSKRNYNHEQINQFVYNTALASVSNQKMTLNEFVRTASCLSSLQMMYIDSADSFQGRISLFTILFEGNIATLGTQRNCEFSISDTWNELFTLEKVFLPCKPVPFKNISEMITTQSTIEDDGYEFDINEESFKNCAQKTLSKVCFSKDSKELLKQYLDGELSLFALREKPIRFQNANKYQHVCTSERDELTGQELFVKALVENRFVEENVILSLRRAMHYAERYCTKEQFEKIIGKAITMRFDAFYNPGLVRLYQMKPSSEVLKIPTETADILPFINAKLYTEKKLCQIAQTEFFTWCNLFGFKSKNQCFNNIEAILQIAKEKRGNNILCGLDDDLDDEGETSKANELDATQVKQMGVFGRIKETLRQPFQHMANIDLNIANSTEKFNEFVSLAKEKFVKIGGENASQAFTTITFDTFQNTLTSVKVLINAWFQDFTNKICELFGVKSEIKIEATTLLLYYMIWVRTDCLKLKTMLVLDILVSLGVFDFVMDVVVRIYKEIASYFEKPKMMANSEDFEEGLKDLGMIEQTLKKENKKNRDEVFDVNVDTNKDESGDILSKVVDWLSSATTPILGIAATALVATLGWSPLKGSKESIGTRIVASAKNVGYLAMGIAALPKIFENIMKVINFVLDHARKVFVKGHQTKMEKMQTMANFVAKAQYDLAISPKIFVRSVEHCLVFMEMYAQMKEIEKDAHTIANTALIREFDHKRNVMKQLYPIVQSSIRLTVGGREVFHVQLFSSEVGVGKTDVAMQLLKIFGKVMNEIENEMRPDFGVDKNVEAPYVNNFYPMNSSLKHNDMYYGQPSGYVDEENIFTNTDAEIVYTRMMLISGMPTISSQASLQDKGRVFELKTLVSNTNNPYLQILNMPNVNALHRRRELIKVEVRPEYKGRNGTGVNDEAIRADGVDRTRGEHLMFTYMHPTEQNAPKDRRFVQMDIVQLKRLISVLLRNHVEIEEKRMFERCPITSILRNYVDFNLKAIEDTIGIPYLGGEKGTKMINRIIEKAKTIQDKPYVAPQYMSFKRTNARNPEKDLTKEESVMYEEGEKILDELQMDYETVREHYKVEDDEAINQLLKETNKTMSDEAVEYKLAQNGEFIHLIRSAQLHYVIESEMSGDYVWDQSLKQVKYKGKLSELSEVVQRRILYTLFRMKFIGKSSDAEIAIKRLSSDVNVNIMRSKYREMLLSCKLAAKRAADSVATWVKRSIIDQIGNSLMVGISVGISICAMFFSLSVIGQMLSPTPVSYNQRLDTRRKDSSRVLPVSRNDEVDDEVHLIKKSMYRCYVVCGTKMKTAMAIGVEGQVFLMNRHSFASFVDTAEIYVYDHSIGNFDASHGVKKYNIIKKDLSYIPGCDAVLVYIRDFRPVKAAFKHFVTEEDLADDLVNFHVGQFSAYCFREDAKPTREMKFTDCKRKYFTTGFGNGFPVRYESEFEHNRVIKFTTGNEIQPGDSGAICMHDNPKIARKFLGILLSKQEYTNSAYIGIVTQEQIKNAMKTLPEYSLIRRDPQPGILLTSENEYFNVFDFNEEVYETPIPNQGISKSSGFKPTPIHGVFPVDSYPAIQDIRDQRIPEDARHFLQVSMNKTSGKNEPYFTRDEEKFMKNFLKQTFLKYIPGLSEVRVYDTMQAIKGVRMMGSTSINTKTCAGLPYKLQRGAKGKYPWISYDQVTKTWQIQDFVFNEVRRYEEIYKQNDIPCGHKIEFRKKELVPIEKILNPKTRTVATGNMIHQIIYNKCLKDMYTMLKNVWERGDASPFALGVDPERHWDQIAKHLKFTENVIDFDVKAWEEKVCLRLLNMTVDVKADLIETAYRTRGEQIPEIRKLLHGLAVDFTDTEVIFENIMYRKRSGLLSGHPGTFMENSEIHEMILALVCYRILKEHSPGWATIDFIQEHVRSIKAADDIQIAVSNTASVVITAKRLVEGYNALGFEVTSADKLSEIRFKKLIESQFLKHGFKIVNDEFVCVPNLSIVHQLFNWMRDDTALSQDEQFMVNIENAFRFAFWRGEEEYEEIRAKANCALMRSKIHWNYDYADMRTKIQQIYDDIEHENTVLVPKPENENILSLNDRSLLAF